MAVWAVVLVVAAVVAWVGAFMRPGPATAGTSAASAQAALPGRHPVPAATGLAQAVPASVSLTADDAVPPGVTADQWQRLRAEMANRADGAAELRRLADYFAYSDQVQRLRRLRVANPSDPQLVALARSVDAGLADHLQRNEVSFGEARLLKMAALDVLVPDDAQRAQQLTQWQAEAQQQVQAQDAQDPDADVADAQARDAAFKRSQAAVVARWQAQPAAQRSTQQLGQQLDALRQSSYSKN